MSEARRSAGRVLWICGAILIAAATLTPSTDTSWGGVNWCLLCGELGGEDAVLNIALFIPLGMGLAMAGVRARRAIPAMILATVLIESLQISIIPGRDASLTDLLTNAVGGAIGYLIGARIDRLLRPTARSAFRLMGGWMALWLVWQAVAGYSLRPNPSDSQYFGQILHSLGGNPPYPGEVTSAALDGVPIPDGAFNDSKRARSAIGQRDGARFDLTVVPHARVTRPTAIIRIGDREQREVLLAAANGSDLAFGVQAGASVLRLRPLVFSLRNALPLRAARSTAGGGDTVRFTARYGFRQVTLNAGAGRDSQQVVLSNTVGKAWRLMSPLPIPVDGAPWQSGMDALWMLACLVPAGFWGGIATDVARTRRYAGVWALLTALISVGLAAAPIVFHVAAPAAGEVVGALTGLVVGAVLCHVSAGWRNSAV